MGMRALVLILAIAPAVASAEPFHGSSWYEAGVVRSRIDTGDGHLAQGYAIRFSPRVAVHPHLYIGGELDAGSLDGQVATPPSAYRTTGGEMNPATAVTGKLGAVRFVVGTRARAGMISAGAELALGMRSAELEDQWGVQIGTVDSMAPTLEGRGRLDVWLTPQFTIGGIAGVDLSQSRDVTAGLMLGFHWGNYDGVR
jgi:hypothetical protein